MFNPKFLLCVLCVLCASAFNSPGQNPGTTTRPLNAASQIPAANITFTQTGTGAAATTLDARGKAAPINAKTDFGAIGNDTADDTAALQAALDAGKAQFRPVYIPAGKYKITTTLTAYWIGMTIYGDGQGTTAGAQGTIIKQYTNGQGGLSVPHNPDDNLCIHDLQFFDASSANTSVGLYLNGDSDATPTPGAGNNIDDLYLYNVTVSGFQTCAEMFGVANTLCQNCSWLANAATTTCVYYHGNNNSNTFTTCPTVLGASTLYGYHLTGGRGCTIQGNDLVGNASGSGSEVYVDGAVGVIISALNIENYGTGNPIVFVSGSGKVSNVAFNPLVHSGTTGAYAIEVYSGINVEAEGMGATVIRINGTVSTHQVTSVAGACTADIYPTHSSGSATYSGVLIPPVSIASTTLPAFMLTGTGGSNQAAVEWGYNGGSYFFSARAGNTVSVDTWDLYAATNASMSAGQVVGIHFIPASNIVSFPGGLQVSGNANFLSTIYANSAAGTTGQVLTSGGAGNPDTWSTPAVVSGVLHLTPQATPGSPTEGDVYVNSSDHHTYEYNGSAWKQLDN